MQRTLSACLALTLWLAVCPVFADDHPLPQTVETVDEQAMGSDAVTVVEPEHIPVVIRAVRLEKEIAKEELKRKILREYVPVSLTIENKSNKMLRLPPDSIFFVNEKGEQQPIPTQEEMFKELKRNGVGRALAWAIPLGAVSFGILAIPAAAYSGVHTKVMNRGVKDNLATNGFHGASVAPEGFYQTYVFIAKRHAPSIKQIKFSRIINLEDEIETSYVIDIENQEMNP